MKKVDNRFQIPADLTPQNLICFTIMVPDDDTHIANLNGALSELGHGNAYTDDDAHSARVLSRYWRKLLMNGKFDKCNLPAPTIGGTGLEFDDMNELLQVVKTTDGKCILQYRCCVEDDWINVAAIGDLGNTGSPGDGAPQPPPGGGKQDYCYGLQGNGVLLVPTTVSTGDVLTLNSAVGSAWDGGFGHDWTCFDGEVYFLGQCAGGSHLDGADPLPTASHMALLYNIGGTLYDATTGPVTVPAGVTSALVTIQVNDSDITDNAGSFLVCLTVTNNQAATFKHTFDFTKKSWGWIPSVVSGETFGVWVAGTGWKSTLFTPSNDGLLQIRKTFPARTITKLEINYTRTTTSEGSHPGSGTSGILSSVLQWNVPATLAIGTHDFIYLESQSIDEISMLQSTDTGNANPAWISELTVYGLGADPF
jgi:hypothetical protein